MNWQPPTGTPLSTDKPLTGVVIDMHELDELVKSNTQMARDLADNEDWPAYALAEASRAVAHTGALEIVVLNVVKVFHEQMGYPSFEAAMSEVVLLRSDLMERSLNKALQAINEKVAKPKRPERTQRSAYL